MIIKRKFYSGYEEIKEGLDGATEYINSQVGNAGELMAENVLDPLDKLGEYYDKSPIQPRKVSRVRKVLKPLSYLLKRERKHKDKKK